LNYRSFLIFWTKWFMRLTFPQKLLSVMAIPQSTIKWYCLCIFHSLYSFDCSSFFM
jgi:hypothetical protein